ncbi:AAA family ATPase [Elizabethkingia sp. JS20170427COW]|uniref:AAA family ATPase n=1 Tax=Elizabethkingia sp. JS20170427COW TaxID=2583851 RepID=UPI001110BB8D|nr:SMC family ATPase [Elizabethkingia sp. JS20170427COW]QCX53742.1 SMC family ATPase [Elizabethkingia sp. JS20170427COW]
MLPLRLTIEGLYSYQERQTIDFTELTEAGLFGVFGQVGSGKSSILEAITYALYGESERLNARDKRAYNMMNLKSNRSYLEFDFENHQGKKFRATREFKRNSKNFNDVKPTQSVFYEWENEEWKPLDHTQAEKILDLTYQNFKRTIIIPQGQFKEFLELGAKDRTEMMKEIFQLHRFDLQNKVAHLSKSNQSLLDILKGKLLGFEEVSEEKISQLEDEGKGLEELMTEHQQHFIQQQNIYNHLKNTKGDFDSLSQKKEKYAKLNQEEEKYKLKEKKLEQYEQYYQLFSEKIKLVKDLKIDITSKKEECDKHRDTYDDLSKKVRDSKQQLEEWKAQFDALKDRQEEEQDLHHIIKTLEAKKEIEKLEKRIENGNSIINTTREKCDNIKTEIEGKEKELHKISGEKLDATLLISVEKWFSDRKNLQNNQKQIQFNILEIEKEISQYQEKLKTSGIASENFEEAYANAEKTIRKQQDEQRVEKGKLEVQQQIARYADALHDGENCPLCGSKEHPHIIEIDDVSEGISQLEVSLKKLDSELKDWNTRRDLFREIQQAIALKNGRKTKEEEAMALGEKQLDQHQLLFIWKEFKADQEEEFYLRKEQTLVLEKKINLLSEELVKLRKNYEDTFSFLSKYEKGINDLNLSKAKKEGEAQQGKEHLKRIIWEDYQNSEVDEVRQKAMKLQEFIQSVESQYQKIKEENDVLSQHFSKQKGLLEASEQHLKDLEAKLQKLQGELQGLLEQQNISLESVENILSENMNVSKERNEIQEFNIEYKTLKNSIQELEDKLKGVEYSEEKYLAAQQKYKEQEELLANSRKELLRKQDEINRLKKSYEEKKEVLKEQETLEKRGENLKILNNLFKAQGFVQYVSTIYLRQLCDHANQRFHRMTRNQLSLQINENNDFEIIDYLNEGKSRSVKTLSGGQAFQVSLSLALALAESVQAHARSEKNFFFIDEGFGTQDIDSVNLVFETLLNLQKENRIVGIISHVEELKEKIPMSLSIVKDEVRGSIIH